MDFLWVYVLGFIATGGIVSFVVTFSRDVKLTGSLKLKKISLSLNISLLVISSISIGLVIYLFSLLRNQIELIG